MHVPGVDTHKLILFCMVLGLVAGAVGALAVVTFMPHSDANVFKDFYDVETVVSVSPSDYLKDLKSGIQDGLVVDLRDPASYAAGHLVTAVNVNASSMTEAQLVAAFRALPQDKPFITYCYSSYCMLSREVGKALADNGIHAKHLTAGSYEIMRDYPTYVVTGPTPGHLDENQLNKAIACDINGGGEFGC